MAQPSVSSGTEIISLAIFLFSLIVRYALLAVWPVEVEGIMRLLLEATLLVLFWATVSYRAGFREFAVWILGELWKCAKSNPTAVLNLIPSYFLVFFIAAMEKHYRVTYGWPEERYSVAAAAVIVNTVATFGSIFVETEPRPENSQELTTARGFYRVVLLALALLLLILPFARLFPFQLDFDWVLALLCAYVCARLGQILYKEFN